MRIDKKAKTVTLNGNEHATIAIFLSHEQKRARDEVSKLEGKLEDARGRLAYADAAVAALAGRKATP